MRHELQTVLDGLLAASADSRQVTLDDIGEALAGVTASSVDIDAILTGLEQAGREVLSPRGDRLKDLQRVLAAARRLGASLGRRPTLEEIAADEGITVSDVRVALLVGKVMGTP